jgi:hypothetical protein
MLLAAALMLQRIKDELATSPRPSQYRAGERSTDWLKWRAHRGQELVVGAYILGIHPTPLASRPAAVITPLK